MEPTKRCPYCGELILRIAIRCKHCQSDLHGVDAASTAPPPLTVMPPSISTGNAASAGWNASGAIVSAQPSSSSGPVAPSSSAALVPSSSAPSGPAPSALSGPAALLGGYVAPTEGSFEQRFLDFAFRTNLPISAATVAFALKITIDEAEEGLQELAARDVLVREQDSRGATVWVLPGRAAVAAAAGAGASGALTPYAQPPQMLYDPTAAMMLMPTENTAIAGLIVNVCFPGLGSLIGGQTSPGVFQLLMFLLGLPLCLVYGLGVPFVMGAWIWSLVTGVNMVNEARQTNQRRTLAGG